MKVHSKSALKLFKKHLARFFTIIAIVIVSVGFMSGIGEVENKIKIGLNDYYLSKNISDIYIKSKKQMGFSANEISYIENKFGKENIQKSLCYETKINDDIIRIYSYDIENSKINKLELLEGKFPVSKTEVVVERETSKLKGYNIGDTITLQGTDYTVSGIVLNPLLIYMLEEYSYQFEDEYLQNIIYINSNNLFITNDIYIKIDDKSLFDSYSDEYKLIIDNLKLELEQNLGDDNVSVLTLYENIGLFSLDSYAEKVGLIGIIFVVFFLLITLLVVYSTMTRLLDEERSQIACLKTLGYSDFSIVKKYVSFVFISTLIGGIFAFGVGFGLTKIIYIAFNIQYTMPPFPNTFNFIYFLTTFVIILFSTVTLTFITGMSIVNNKPVTLLTPKMPKTGKKVFLERIPFIWNRLSFKYKSTLRNVFLFKSRFFMTVISIIGSTILVLAGMGLMDNTAKIDGGASILTIAIALIIFSAILCALVVYNITNINVSERNREIATLMVLGYHDNEVSGYIFREIYIMSFIGAIIGIPLGALFLDFAFNLIDFGRVADINWWTWIIAPVLTMIFSFISTLLLRPKITKTDMNGSLKTLE